MDELLAIAEKHDPTLTAKVLAAMPATNECTNPAGHAPAYYWPADALDTSTYCKHCGEGCQ